MSGSKSVNAQLSLSRTKILHRTCFKSEQTRDKVIIQKHKCVSSLEPKALLQVRTSGHRVPAIISKVQDFRDRLSLGVPQRQK